MARPTTDIEQLARQARKLAATHTTGPAIALRMAAACCDEALVRLGGEPFAGYADDPQ